MGALDRLRRRRAAERPATVTERPEPPVDEQEESRLWGILREDPNDVEAFHRLADIVRRKAAEGHEGIDQTRAANDAVWSLAEELAHSGHAWYPLIELARLSVHDDRDAAMRRLATAAERDASGQSLSMGLAMLRDAGMPGDALGLGVGHWRPREHDLEAGRELVEAAVEAGRVGEARRHLEALTLHPDQDRARRMRAELERRITDAEKSGPAPGVGQRTPPTPSTPAFGLHLPPGEVWSTGEPTQTSGPGTGGLPVLDPEVVDLRPAEAEERPGVTDLRDGGDRDGGVVHGRGLRDRFRRR